MALIYQALELVDGEGRPTGRWRQTYRCDESPRLCHALPLCQCVNGHESRAAARACPVVQHNLPQEMRDGTDDPQDVSW